LSSLTVKVTLEQAAVFNETLDVVSTTAVKIATQPKLQLCGGWEQTGYALDGCVDAGLLRPPPQPHSSQLGTVYATKRRRRNGKRCVLKLFLVPPYFFNFKTFRVNLRAFPLKIREIMFSDKVVCKCK
jgi:hypothetical protein